MTPATGEKEAAPGTNSGRLTPADLSIIIFEFLWYMGKALMVFYPVYLTGAFGLSISWILLSLLLWSLWEKNRKNKDVRIDSAISFLENESHVIKNEMKALNMPAWVSSSKLNGV